MTEPITDLPGPDHRAEPATAPNKAFWRTVLQVGPTSAVALLLILPEVLQDVLDHFGRDLPPDLYGFLVATVAALTLVAGIIARVMANAKVIEWTRKYLPFFAPSKTPKS
ncbi:hypothetical protein PP641_gp040 [Arthrobacter phage SilentRX]|uniref:Uncharacterized protein n=1 Tax=Arthrobacter phage SilentRX TaxID=2836091 RepID=A0A8F3E7F1_9CAUD|nr:hypothetical protein PP641_gp040 [Arthrobacter phage SilentRX]QWY82780.1 hypothetical protein SEA_SILENTRX_40 [Arthrobacter phage SilentRX]